MSQDEKGGMGILQILLIIAILIGLLPVFFWMVALQKFGTEANYTEAHTSFALIFCTVVQLVLWVIFWATSESCFVGFFTAYGINLAIATAALLCGLALGHNPLPVN